MSYAERITRNHTQKDNPRTPMHAKRRAASKPLPPAIVEPEDVIGDATNADIKAQSPVLESLLDLGDTVRVALTEAGKTIATGLECLAWEADRQRRGLLCAPARQDEIELARTIIDLLKGELLDAEGRADLVAMVRAALPAAPKRKATKTRRAKR